MPTEAPPKVVHGLELSAATQLVHANVSQMWCQGPSGSTDVDGDGHGQHSLDDKNLGLGMLSTEDRQSNSSMKE